MDHQRLSVHFQSNQNAQIKSIKTFLIIQRHFSLIANWFHFCKFVEQTIITSGLSTLNQTGSFYLDSAASRLFLTLYSLSDKNLRVTNLILTAPTGQPITDYDVSYSPSSFYAANLVAPNDTFGVLQPFPKVRNLIILFIFNLKLIWNINLGSMDVQFTTGQGHSWRFYPNGHLGRG